MTRYSVTLRILVDEDNSQLALESVLNQIRHVDNNGTWTAEVENTFDGTTQQITERPDGPFGW